MVNWINKGADDDLLNLLGRDSRILVLDARSILSLEKDIYSLEIVLESGLGYMGQLHIP